MACPGWLARTGCQQSAQDHQNKSQFCKCIVLKALRGCRLCNLCMHELRDLARASCILKVVLHSMPWGDAIGSRLTCAAIMGGPADFLVHPELTCACIEAACIAC